ncbi:MAG: glycerophosphodiester phosphodiesterase [Ilumatobacteraceae bacterium]
MRRFQRNDKAVAALAACVVTAAVAAVAVVRWRSDHDVAGRQDDRDRGEQQLPDGSNPFRTGHTLVIPHGGGDGLFPEDTLLAFERTIAMGADVVDVDLRLSEDDEVVAFHDATVDRITGRSGSIGAMTYEELSRLDAGWSFTTAGGDPSTAGAHPYRGQGITIPTFESILDEFPTTLLSVDLKDESLDMVDPVCELLRGHRRFNDVFVGSNSDAQILEFRRRCPDVRTSAIMGDVYAARDARASHDQNFVPAVTVDQPPFRSGDRQRVDAASLTWAHQHGIAILTWVVNDVDDMKLLVDLGVDGIYTSYPDRLLKILGRCTAAC